MWQHISTNERLDQLERTLSQFFRGVSSPSAEGGQVAATLDHHLTHLLVNMEKRLMSALTDLQAAIADLATQLASNNAEIDTLLTKITTPGTSDADIAAATASIRDLIAANKTEVDKAVAAAP